MERKLVTYRFEPELIEALDEARQALRKGSLTELVREALWHYLDEHRREIRAHRRREKRVLEEARA
jgi:hypothetical protein